MDIAAFHADGVRPADIRKGVVADHQNLGSGDARFFESRTEKGRGRLFYAEVGREEDPVKNSVEKVKTPEFRYGKAALGVGQQIQAGAALTQSLQRLFCSFHQLRRAAEGQYTEQQRSVLHPGRGDGNVLFLKQAPEDIAQLDFHILRSQNRTGGSESRGLLFAQG